MEKLNKENIYINLQGKSKEELNLITEITGVENLKNYYYLHFYTPLNKWIRYHVWTDNIENKTEVTINQLKEIIKPMDLTIEQRLEKAEAEVKKLREAIEDIKIKVGDWVYIDNTKCFFKVSDNDVNYLDNRHRKITNPELIKLLEQEIK